MSCHHLRVAGVLQRPLQHLEHDGVRGPGQRELALLVWRLVLGVPAEQAQALAALAGEETLAPELGLPADQRYKYKRTGSGRGALQDKPCHTGLRKLVV
jgi:hypothetical protein